MKVNYPITVGTTAIQAVVPDKARTSLIIFNNSTTATVYYGSDNTLSATTGVPIPPRSGLAFSRETGDDPSVAYWLVASAVGTDVRIGEGRVSREG